MNRTTNAFYAILLSIHILIKNLFLFVQVVLLTTMSLTMSLKKDAINKTTGNHKTSHDTLWFICIKIEGNKARPGQV
jgi:hypothetical protein